MKTPATLPSLLLFCLLICPLTKSEAAATADWTSASGGLYSDDANWNPDVPATTGTGNFNLNNTYTVDFDADAQVRFLNFTFGDVTFDIGAGNVLQYGSASTSDLAITVGNASTFRVTSGSLTSASIFTVGNSASTANFVLEGGATMTSGTFRFAYTAGQAANATITGASTQLTTTLFDIRRGNGNLTISDGATVGTGASNFNIAGQSGQSTVTVDDGTLNVGGNLLVGQERLTTATDAKLFVSDGGTVTATTFEMARQDPISAATTGALGLTQISGVGSSVSVANGVLIGQRSVNGGNANLSNQGSLRILDGGQFLSATSANASRDQNIGSGATTGTGRGVGIVEIDGTDSAWIVGNATQTTNVTFGHSGGQGFLTLSNGGKMEMVAGDEGTMSFLGQSELSIESGLLIGNSLSFESTVIFKLTLSDSDVAPLIVMADGFNPGNATLELTLAPSFSTPGTSFVIAVYDDWSGLEFGTVIGLPSNAVLSYEANQFILTVIPEPGAGTLVLLGSALLWAMRRKQSRRI